MAKRNLLKLLLGITFIWLVILLYMGTNFYQLVEESQRTASQLMQVEVEADLLRKENIQLRQETNMRKIRAIDDDIKMTFQGTASLRDTIEQSHSFDNCSKKYAARVPSLDYEFSQRRLDNYIREMNYFLSAKLDHLQKKAGNFFKANDLEKFSQDVVQLSAITMNELEELRGLDGMAEHRRAMHRKLSNEIQQRFHKLQNPENCRKARRLVCTLNKGCGYGCQIHHVIYCMIMAYSSNRTMIMNSVGWRYSRKGWEGTFLPVSESCKGVPFGRVYWGMAFNTKALIAHLPVIDSIYPRPLQLPQAAPHDLVDRILQFHEIPYVWWVGQVCAYLFRYQPSMKQRIDEKKERLGFKSPIVGMHVRRTDKIGIESDHHRLDEYMKWAKFYFDKLELKNGVDTRRIFIATDDQNLLQEAQAMYPDYQFCSDQEASRLAGLDHRHSEASLYGVITDIELLSESDYLVCTFSSQVCRLAYEIMNAKHVDASRKFHSLDDIYYYGGQNEHKVKVRYSHKPRNKQEIDLVVGEELAISGNHWDGYSKAYSHRSRLEGIFPSYKVEEVVNIAEFPNYQP